ncbi:MAG: DJ-1/PfpI family protein [Pirellulales bacterium]|nr:DJ-1/PfpI family protein [Pirellulales bacterium]
MAADCPTTSLAVTPSPLDFEFDVPSAPVTKPARRQRARFFAGNGATALALLGIAAAAVMAAPLWELIGPRYGARNAIRNGGDGRALVIVGANDFREDQFQSLAKKLAAREIEVVAASANYGTPKKDFGGSLKAPYHNVNLAQAKAADFDAIFVVGGTCRELKNQKSDAHREVVRIVESALQNDVVLTGCCEGCLVLKGTKLFQKKEYWEKTRYETYSADELAGKAELIFESLLANRAGQE